MLHMSLWTRYLLSWSCFCLSVVLTQMHYESALMISLAVKCIIENTWAVSLQNQKYLSVEDISPYERDHDCYAYEETVEKADSEKESWETHPGEKIWGKWKFQGNCNELTVANHSGKMCLVGRRKWSNINPLGRRPDPSTPWEAQQATFVAVL